MRIIVGMTGASGVILGIRFLEALKQFSDCESHLVLSDNAVRTIELETKYTLSQVLDLADKKYDIKDMAANISSGSFKTDGMVVCPCTMKTLAGIAHGFDDNLLIRAANVCLKEGRKVVLVPREMPLNLVHIKNMRAAMENGCYLCPPMLTFYNHPQSVDDMIDHIIGKILMQYNLDFEFFRPWGIAREE